MAEVKTVSGDGARWTGFGGVGRRFEQSVRRPPCKEWTELFDDWSRARHVVCRLGPDLCRCRGRLPRPSALTLARSSCSVFWVFPAASGSLRSIAPRWPSARRVFLRAEGESSRPRGSESKAIDRAVSEDGADHRWDLPWLSLLVPFKSLSNHSLRRVRGRRFRPTSPATAVGIVLGTPRPDVHPWHAWQGNSQRARAVYAQLAVFATRNYCHDSLLAAPPCAKQGEKLKEAGKLGRRGKQAHGV